MTAFDERRQANMDVILDDVCAQLPNGGDHESRKYIAEQLINAAKDGNKKFRRVDLRWKARTASPSEQTEIRIGG